MCVPEQEYLKYVDSTSTSNKNKTAKLSRLRAQHVRCIISLFLSLLQPIYAQSRIVITPILGVGNFIDNADLHECKMNLLVSDKNNDGEVSSIEYRTFLRLQNNTLVSSDDKIPLSLVSAFNIVACVLCPMDEVCCEGNEVGITITSGKSNQDRDYFLHACTYLSNKIRGIGPANISTRAPINYSSSPSSQIMPMKNSKFPTQKVSFRSSTSPTTRSTQRPTALSTKTPTKQPTISSTAKSTKIPTIPPTQDPTFKPSSGPSIYPSRVPTKPPLTIQSTKTPTSQPNFSPTACPACQRMINQPSTVPTIGFNIEPTNFPTYGGLISYNFLYTIELNNTLSSESILLGTKPRNDVHMNLIAATIFVLQIVLVQDLYPEGSEQLGFYRVEKKPIITNIFKNSFLCSPGLNCFTIKSSIFIFLNPEESEDKVRLAIKRGFMRAFYDGTFKKSVSID